jgi:hypothetical protein
MSFMSCLACIFGGRVKKSQQCFRIEYTRTNKRQEYELGRYVVHVCVMAVRLDIVAYSP